MADQHHKQAALGAALKGLLRSGVWKTVGNATAGKLANKGLSGVAARGLNNTSKFMGGRGGNALQAYGMAGLVSPLAGVELPGSSLALGLSTPGWGAAMSAAPLITSARLNSAEMQRKIEDDAQQGARNAASDFISAAAHDPRSAHDAARYRGLLEQNGVNFAGADEYEKGTRVRPMSAWSTLGGVFENPDKLIANKVQQRVQGFIDKEANILSSTMRTAGKVLPWVFGASTLAGAGHAMLADKPYDADAVQQEGYSGAQVAIQRKLKGMNSLERMAVKLDPTLAIRGLEQKLPGSVKNWEAKTGQAYRPGLLSSVADYWNSGGGEQKFYQYDASGNRHYLK